MSDDIEECGDTTYLSKGVNDWQGLISNYIPNPLLRDQVKKIGNNFRRDPLSEKQSDFFIPTLSDITNKDDQSLMDISPFGLGKKPRFTPIEYDLKDAVVTVSGSSKYGMATIFDYDIVIFIVSHLTREMQLVKNKVQYGNSNPVLPSRKIQPMVSDLFKFLKIKSGGEQYKLLMDKLARLKGTVITIDKKGSSKRRGGGFSLIGEYKVASETQKGNVSEIEIGIPDWIYDGIVTPETPTVLTLDPKYMLLKSGYHKFLDRIARKSAGKSISEWKLKTLYERSGTSRGYNKFKYDILNSIEALSKNPLPDYDVRHKIKSKVDYITFVYKHEDKESNKTQ